jgi:hypothetical protein
MFLRSALHAIGSSRVPRRGILRIGALGASGPSLSQLLHAESATGLRNSRKAIINIHLDGGPPHLDTIDPKPEAPVEIRGEFDTISTSLPGVHVTELLPKIASIAEKFVLIRSLTGSAGAHDAFQCQSGYPAKDLESLGGRPAVGCVVSRLHGRSDDPRPRSSI